MIKYIAFDFDGTLIDTFEVAREEGNKILARYNIYIDAEEARQIGLRKTIFKAKFPISDVLKCHAELRRNMNARLNTDVKAFSGIKDLIKELSLEYILIIVSSSSKDNIKKCLDNNDLLDYFNIIYSESSLFGKHRVLKSISKKYHIKQHEFLYVGDEDRDIIAAKRIGIKNIAVTWGYNTINRLSEENPDGLIQDVSMLKLEIERLNAD